MSRAISFILCFGWFLQGMSSTQELVNQIAQEQPASILFYDDGKLYLKPEVIKPTSSGIYSVSENSVILLPYIFSNSRGCYIPIDQISETNLGSVSAPLTCPNCGYYPWWYSPAQSRCPKCRYGG